MPRRTRVAATPQDPPATPEAGASTPSVHLSRIATLYQAVQRDRVGLELSLQRKSDVHDAEASAIYDRLVEIEHRIVQYLHRESTKSPAWTWLSQIKGVGPRLGGMLIGLIDISRANTVSALWRYAGLAVIDGKAERRKAGETLHYNNTLKKTCFLLARQLIMARNEVYEPIYRDAKAWYAEHRPDWSPGHLDLAARRKMVKIFLSHLWEVWRRAAGLPTRMPYAIERDPAHASGYIAPPPA